MRYSSSRAEISRYLKNSNKASASVVSVDFQQVERASMGVLLSKFVPKRDDFGKPQRGL
jgi:hypothetical protein